MTVELPRPPWDVDDEFFFWLDLPQSWEGRNRWLTLAGWCLPKSDLALRGLRVIAGRTIFKVDDRVDRPDVIEFLQADANKVACGFWIDVKVPSGRSRLRVEALSESGIYRGVFEKEVCGPVFTRRRRQKPQPFNNRTTSQFVSWLDRPLDWENVGQRIFICGWCVHPKLTLTAVRARIGGTAFAGSYGIQRPDLRQACPNLPYAHCAGFAVVARLSRGRHELLLETCDSEGAWHVFFQRHVLVRHSAQTRERLFDAELFDSNRRDLPSRFGYWLEPRCDWARLPQRQRLAGWCLPMWGAPIEAIRARIGHRRWLAKIGITRPEVQAAYPELQGSLNSGFALTFEPPLGRSVLWLDARSNKTWEPFFSYRIHRPLFWRRGENRFGSSDHYDNWLRLYERLDFWERRAVRQQIKSFKHKPKFSILIPCYNSDPGLLRAAIRSVQRQLYGHWEICAVDDGSERTEVWPLLQRMAGRDRRIRVCARPSRGHISAASNDALKMARSDYIVLLDHDDELSPLALYSAACELNRQPELEILYADEDKLDESGHRFAPFFKPDWSQDLLLAQNYAIHPLIVRTTLARAAGGFDSKYDGAQDLDFILRCWEQTNDSQIRRIPQVLYHWRTAIGSTADLLEAKEYAAAARQAAVKAHLLRRGVFDATISAANQHFQRVQYQTPDVLVSIIIPTRDRGELLRRCLRSIEEKNTYPHYELVLVDNGSTEASARTVLEAAAAAARTKVISLPEEFNFSQLCNAGAKVAKGEVLLFLNNDVEAINQGWLAEMVSQAMRSEIGVVGASLWLGNERLQHAGIVLNPQRIGSYPHFRLPRGASGYFSQLHLVRNVAAVTGACMAVRAKVYAQLGGMNERELPVAFNDIDFCLRVLEIKLRVLWTPHAELIHHESSSRGLEDTVEKQERFQREIKYMQKRWAAVLQNDPFYNPNLDLTDDLYGLAFPPRLPRPGRETITR